MPRKKKQPGAAPAAPVARKSAPAKAAKPKQDAPAIALSLAEQLRALPAHHRENPAMLEGDLLRYVAYQKGVSQSELADMDDVKIRMVLRLRAQRFHDERG